MIAPRSGPDRAAIVVLDYLPSTIRWRSGKLGSPDRTIKLHHDRDQHLEHPPSDGDPPLDEASTVRWRLPHQMSPRVALIEFRDRAASRSFDEDQMLPFRPCRTLLLDPMSRIRSTIKPLASDLQLVHLDASMCPPMIRQSCDESRPSDDATWCKVSP